MAEAGKVLTMDDVQEILDAVETRKRNFPDEPIEMTWALVLFNIGDRYASVSCINGEWKGIKKDIPRNTGMHIPVCPNGHPLTQGIGLQLGWLPCDLSKYQ